MKPKTDFDILLWLILIMITITGCTTGVGALWKMHKAQEAEKKWERDNYNLVVDTNGVSHWEKK